MRKDSNLERFLLWLEPSDRDGRAEKGRKRTGDAYVTNASSCKQNDVLGGWGERRIILRSTMSSDYSYFVPLVLIRGDTPVQAAIMSAI